MRVPSFTALTALVLAVGVGPGCPPRPEPSPSPEPTPTATPTPPPPPTPSDLRIGINLQRDASKKCMVGFDRQVAKSAVAYTGFQVIWEITRNDCGDLKKGGLLPKKALGLKRLDKHGGHAAKWFDRCTTLPFVPAVFSTSPEIRCFVPSTQEGDVEGLYDYELDGDEVDPVDPELDVKKGR